MVQVRVCECKVPRDRNHSGYCDHCLRRINPEWTSNDETFAEFFDHLSLLPEVDPAFIVHCQDRERAGREDFGHSHLGRDNAADGLEEAADGAIYSHLAHLCAKRDGESELNPYLMIAAHHFALAHLALRQANGR